MRRLALTLSLLATVSLLASAPTVSASPDVTAMVRVARSALVVPAEWDGIYTTVDSTYTCEGVFQSTSAGTDTICGGKDYSSGDTGGSITLQCTGNATATTFDQTCTGSETVITDCDAVFTIVSHGTRTTDAYHIVTTVSVTYVGTGTGCEFLPSSCTQYDTWGTRTGPAPVDYCLTPTKPSSWGEVKTRYR
jgi:hypothetical protein